eukprot:gene9517-12424_t
MQKQTKLGKDSVLVDISAGLGIPLVHAIVGFDVKSAFGIELDRIKWEEEVGTLVPATHAYSFWEGINVNGKMAFGRLFATSSTMQCVAVVQRAFHHTNKPTDEMSGMGFGDVELIKSFTVYQSALDRQPRCSESDGRLGPVPVPGRPSVSEYSQCQVGRRSQSTAGAKLPLPLPQPLPLPLKDGAQGDAAGKL